MKDGDFVQKGEFMQKGEFVQQDLQPHTICV